MARQEPEYTPTATGVVETPEERHKRHMRNRRVAVATGFALGFLAAVSVAALVILFFPPAGALAGLGAKFIIAGIITGTGMLTGLLGGKVGSNVVSNTIEEENKALGLSPELALTDLGKEALKDIKKGVNTLEDVVEGKQEKTEKKVDTLQGKRTENYAQMVEQQRVNAAEAARTAR